MKTSMCSKVMTIANRLAAQGQRRSQAMRKAWELVKAQSVEVKVVGVAAGHRQEVIDQMARLPAGDITVTLARESGQKDDAGDVAVVAGIRSSGNGYIIGQLPHPLAALVAPLIDAGQPVRGSCKEIRGKYEPYMNWGFVVKIAV